MQRINHVDLSSRVYEKIKEMILSGKLPPGKKIVQEKLASEIGVSRTPLLKALQMLEHEFLVEGAPRRGIFVKTMSHQEIVDAFECREGLEGIAARLCASRATDGQIRQFRRLFEPFVDANLTIRNPQYLAADQKFHKSLIAISGNQVISKIEMLGNVHIVCYNQGLIRPPQETLSEHFAIIEAIEKRDEELAERRAKEHLRKSRDRIARSLAETSRTAISL